MWLDVQNESVLGQLIVLVPITTSSHTMWSVMTSRAVARIHLHIPLMMQLPYCWINKWSVKQSVWYICIAHFTRLYTLHRKCVHWRCLWSCSTSMLSWSKCTTNSNSNLVIDHVPTTNTKWMLDLSTLFPNFLLLFSVFKISLFLNPPGAILKSLLP